MGVTTAHCIFQKAQVLSNGTSHTSYLSFMTEVVGGMGRDTCTSKALRAHSARRMHRASSASTSVDTLIRDSTSASERFASAVQERNIGMAQRVLAIETSMHGLQNVGWGTLVRVGLGGAHRGMDPSWHGMCLCQPIASARELSAGQLKASARLSSTSPNDAIQLFMLYRLASTSSTNSGSSRDLLTAAAAAVPGPHKGGLTALGLR